MPLMKGARSFTDTEKQAAKVAHAELLPHVWGKHGMSCPCDLCKAISLLYNISDGVPSHKKVERN
jgi:hypothetical protein